MPQRAGPTQRCVCIASFLTDTHIFIYLSRISKSKSKPSCSLPSSFLLTKGNIRVFCRVRPVSQEEQDSADAKTMLSFDSEDDAVLHLSSKGKVMSFELDKVFPPQATQEEVSGR